MNDYVGPAEALIEAAYRRNLKGVRNLLDKGVDVNAKNSRGVTALWMTALGAHHMESTEMARVLLDRGADPNTKNKYGHTALELASQNGQVDLVKLLLVKGADANDGVSLPAAVLYLEVVKLLVDKGADVDTKTSDGWTALTKAVSQNQTHVVNLLLDRGAHINETARCGWTALMWSVYAGNVEMAERLLKRGADVNGKTPYGRTALMEAAAADHQIEEEKEKMRSKWGPVYPPRMNDCAMVKLLLEHGADVTAKDSCGWTALKRAQKRGIAGIVELLKAHGAKE